MIDSSTVSTLKIRYGHGFGVFLRTLTVVVAVALSFAGWVAGLSDFEAILSFSFFGLVILWCLTFGDTEFQSVARRIQRTWKFLALVPLWRRRYSMDSFRAVQQRRHHFAEDDKVMVGLVFLAGGFLTVQCFHVSQSGDACLEADALQSRIAEVSGLPVSNENVVS